MLILNIKSSPDFSCLGQWSYSKNEIKIGNAQSMSSDIRIDDDNIRKNHISIFVKKNFLFIHNNLHQDNESLLVNGKITTRGEILKKGDLIKIGDTEIEISDFECSEIYQMEELTENLKKIIRGNHPVEQIISILENELKESANV